MEYVSMQFSVTHKFQVVMAVATLYYYLAPAMEAQKVGKSLVRIIRSHREGAYVVLANIANMASKRPVCITTHSCSLLE